MAAHPPLYDPTLHTLDENLTVQVGMYCTCGGVFVQIDPVSHCLPQIEDFRSKHSGKGHGVATPTEALTEREARREAGFRAAGRQLEYKPKNRAVPKDPGFKWKAK